MTLDSENDRNLLKTAVIEYLNHLNQKESLYKQHRFLPSDINPENKTKDDVRGIFYPIYNEMNIITNNQNPKWCKVKLKDTLDELCKFVGLFLKKW